MNKKYVALTFDDGPRDPMIEMIDKFTAVGGHATFLVCGTLLNKENDERIKHAIEAGCELGGHSYNHLSLNKVEELALIEANLRAPYDIVKARYNYDMKVTRLPNHAADERVFEIAKKLGIPLIGTGMNGASDWNPEVPAEEIAPKVIASAYDGGICCLHVNERTCKALDTILPTLKEQGYEFVTVSELFEIKGFEPPYFEQIKGTTAP